jgi:RND family efflux transporter MFP subunit
MATESKKDASRAVSGRSFRIPWATLAALGLVAGVAGYEINRSHTAEAAPTEVPKAVAASSSIRAEARVVVAPGSEVTVASEMDGRIATLHVTEHSVVKAGDVIAELAAREERAHIHEARTQLAEAKVNVEFTEKELLRFQQLGATGVANQLDVDRAEHARNNALARVRSLQAGITRLDRVLEKAKILAPIGGKVTTQHADQGEFIGAGAPLVTIVDFSQLRVEVEVGEFDLARVSKAALATLTAEGFEGSWSGKVLEVPDFVTSRRLKPLDPGKPSDTRVLPLLVSLPDGHPLRLGQRVEVELGVQ